MEALTPKPEGIAETLARATSGRAGDLQLVVSRRFFEKNAQCYCEKLYHLRGLRAGVYGGTVLIYLNSRTLNYGVAGHQSYVQALQPVIQEALLSTRFENAVAGIIEFAGRLFPEKKTGAQSKRTR